MSSVWSSSSAGCCGLCCVLHAGLHQSTCSCVRGLYEQGPSLAPSMHLLVIPCLTASTTLMHLPTGQEVRRVQIDAKFTHEVVRAGDRVYVCDTGNGRILELAFPDMTLVREWGCGKRRWGRCGGGGGG